MRYANDTSLDGMVWLDDQGKAPHLDPTGHLTKPFTLKVTYDSTDRVERTTFHVGALLPPTPAAAELQKAEIRAKAQSSVDKQWAEVEARQQKDTDKRNADLKLHREREAARVKLEPARPTASDSGAEVGNIQGGRMAVASPAADKKTRAKPAPKVEPKTKAKGSTAAKPAGKVDGQGPSKPASGLVHVRHMRSPHDAFILIKNPAVFGTESNWATKEEFKTAEAAEEWAKKNSLKVVNPKK